MKGLRGKALFLLVAVVLMAAAGCTEQEIIEVNPVTRRTDYRIAVVLPLSSGERELYEHSILWMIENLNEAQSGVDGVQLSIEWYEEAVGDAELERLAQKLSGRSDVAAILGLRLPHSLEIFAPYCLSADKPLITASSPARLTRAYSGYGFLWNLVESDISQCEVLLCMAAASEADTVALLASPDEYGQTFIDWAAYIAYELGIHLVFARTCTASSFPDEVRQAAEASCKAVLCIPSSVEEARRMAEVSSAYPNIRFLYSDRAASARFAAEGAEGAEGVTPGADPYSGFNVEYEVRYGQSPSGFSAHLYDMTLLTALSAIEHWRSPSDPSFNNAIRRVVTGTSSPAALWHREGIRQFLSQRAAGLYPVVQGATGQLRFAEKTFTTVLSSVYYQWIVYDGRLTFLDYTSSDPSRRVGRTLASWEWKSSRDTQLLADAAVAYPALRNNYALVVAATSGWANYRHQADAFAVYQFLRRNGYDDDHIFLIAENDILYHDKNREPGIVRTSTEGVNLSPAAEAIDASPSQWGYNDLDRAFYGAESLPTNANDNLLVYWVGHGSEQGLLWHEKSLVPPSYLADLFHRLQAEGRYRKLFVVVETCYSGLVGRACEDIGLHGALIFTAANDKENSKAVNYSPTLQTWLSNAFSNAFVSFLSENPQASYHELYRELQSRTLGSHVSLYNSTRFGRLALESPEEFVLPKATR
jgi:ABC-type branched-subunit amino acid transport system substrate-binding protein